MRGGNGCIGAGFVLRTIAEAKAIVAVISSWFLVCAMLLSLAANGASFRLSRGDYERG